MAPAKPAADPEDNLPTMWVPGALRRPELRKSVAPLDALMDAIRAAERSTTGGGKTVVLRGETGSGKSMLVPPRLLQHATARQPGGPGVICAQPRVLTAVSIAQSVGNYETYGAMLGKNLGWLTGKTANVPPMPTSLLYATVGSVASALDGAEDFAAFAARWKYIVLDEAHERSQELDILLRALKSALQEAAAQPWCPVLVVMSATIDPDEFARYLGTPEPQIIVASGRAYPIATHWPDLEKDPVAPTTAGAYDNFVEAAVAMALRVHRGLGPAPGDIIVFLPGLAQHKEAKKMLLAANTASPGFVVLSIMGPTVAEIREDYVALKAPLADARVTIQAEPPRSEPPIRRIIVANNVAETGITLPDLVAVVDSGWTKRVLYLPVFDATDLATVPASRREIHQRMGRAGRVAPGDFYPLYSEEALAALDEAPPPQVEGRDASQLLARLLPEMGPADAPPAAALDPNDIGLLSPVPPELVQAALEKLAVLGFAHPLVGAPAEPARWVLSRLGAMVGPALRQLEPEIVAAALAAPVMGASVYDVVMACAAVGAGLDTTRLPAGLIAKAFPRALLQAAGATLGSSDDSGTIARAILADANAEAALLLHTVVTRAAASTAQAPAADRVAAVAEEFGLRADAVLGALAERERIAEALLKVGIAPHEPETRSALAAAGSLPDFLRGLVAFKRALLHGFRCNVARIAGSLYLTARGIRVAPPLWPRWDKLPQEILYMRCEMFADRTGIHRASVRGYSVLDGYVLGAAAAGYLASGRMLHDHVVPLAGFAAYVAVPAAEVLEGPEPRTLIAAAVSGGRDGPA